MKTFVLILALAIPVLADGPQFIKPEDDAAYSEAVNIYHDLKYIKAVNVTASTGTFTWVAASSASVVGTLTTNNLNINGTVGGTAAFGKVVQWVSTSTVIGFGTTSTTFVQTNLRGRLSGVSASNSVLICATADFGNNTADNCTYMTIARDGTNLLGGATALVRACSPSTNVLGSDAFTACYVDPTPSAGTNNYSVYIKASTPSSGSLDTVDKNFMLMVELKP